MQEQGRVAQVVDAKLLLVPVRGEAWPGGHDARVGDEDVEAGAAAGELGRGGADVGERGHVARDKCDARGVCRVGWRELGEDGIGGLLVAAGKVNVCGVVFGKFEERGFTDTVCAYIAISILSVSNN